MRPIASVRTWAVRAVCLAAGLGPAACLADDPPPLSGPADGPALQAPAPIASQPPVTQAPAAVPPPSRPRVDRPVLALPGVTMPSTRPLPPADPMPPSLGPTLDRDSPIVTPPTPGAGPAQRGSTTPVLPALPSSRFRGRVIESSPADELLPPIDVPPPGSGRRGSGTSRIDDLPLFQDEPGPDGRDARRRAEDEIVKDKLRDLPSTLPARRPGFFGGRLTNPFAPKPMGDDASDIRAEARSDPAADAALKRRIEKQAAAAVGDKVRNIDVRVVGRSVTIQAHGSRLLQRRAVKRSLEGLPGLSGYRAVVEVE